MCIYNVIIIRSSFTTESKVHDCIITLSLIIIVHVGQTAVHYLYTYMYIHVHLYCGHFMYTHNTCIYIMYIYYVPSEFCSWSARGARHPSSTMACMNTLLHVYSVTDYNVVTRTRYYVLAHELVCIYMYMFLNER